ncbi:uncharacterized protein EV154DRAFT_571283 [Mucor mucedo]|uniref:uncharacterized protein n=1 Tax=Mucor mucedo TaxID=29922 RepID=UPI00221F84D5|nr:uncharacterized protein EV154DRAFT_571283 [Mucor mucedo]KAI7868977.1 hypothetical protein EV154DRAFT_571283 [Mucor mucedo]
MDGGVLINFSVTFDLLSNKNILNQTVPILKKSNPKMSEKDKRTATEARELLKRRFDFNAPGLRFYGTVISTKPGANDKVICKVSEEEEEIRPVNQDDWIMGEVTMDTRLTSGKDYHSNKATFNLSNKLTVSPAEYFLYFLPVEFISDVVIHNINQHALSIMNTWISVTFVEYLTWIALLMNKTYMEYDRFFAILIFHVFEVPSEAQQLLDPRYQIRRFLDAFNKTLAKALTPENLTPSAKNSRRSLIMTLTALSILDTVRDPVKKKYDDVDRNLIATLKRLCEPWFFNGRPIIGDSWFGSPEMTCVLLDHGLHSIMQCLRTERGSYVAMSKSDHHGHHIFAYAFKNNTSMTSNVPRTYKGINGQIVTITRRLVFHDYESHKSSIDANNNSRDNMISFYDIMKTLPLGSSFLVVRLWYCGS